MIVKILARHSPSYASLIDYILNENKSNGHESQIFTHNIRSEWQSDWVDEFKENEAFRLHPRANNVYAYHEIISFSSKESSENISKEVLSDIANKYIELRGNEGIYIGNVHFDKNHVHIHFISSGLAFRSGKAFRLSHSKLQSLKVDLQQYHLHKFPSLVHSICEHGNNKTKYSQREWQAKQREQRNLSKTDISQKVQSCFAKATSLREFLHLLRDAGLHHYERRGKVQGIISPDGIKFRFTKLGIDTMKLNSLTLDTKEEMKVLKEIDNLRQNMKDKSNNKQLNNLER